MTNTLLHFKKTQDKELRDIYKSCDKSGKKPEHVYMPIYHLMMSYWNSNLKYDDSDVWNANMDGGNDKGIDSIIFEANGELHPIFSLPNFDSAHIKFFSHKSSDGSFSENELSKLITFFEMLITDKDSDRGHKKLKKAIDLMEKNKKRIEKISFIFSFTNGSLHAPSPETERKINKLREKLSVFFGIDVSKIKIEQESTKKLEDNFSYSIEWKSKIFDFDENLKFSKVNLFEIYEAFKPISNKISKFKNQIYYDQNVRGFYGKNITNKKIIDSVCQSPETFGYLNNGITIAHDGLSAGAMKNPKVINGLQTIHSIMKAIDENGLKPEYLRRGFVVVKLIDSAENEIDFQKIVVATNTQTKISFSDSHIAFSSTHKQIEALLLEKNIGYERMKSSLTNKKYILKISPKDFAASVFSSFGESPRESKLNSTLLISSGEMDEAVFGSDLKLSKNINAYLFSYLALKKIKDKIKDIQKTQKGKKEMDVQGNSALVLSEHILFRYFRALAKRKKISLNVEDFGKFMNDKNITKLSDINGFLESEEGDIKSRIEEVISFARDYAEERDIVGGVKIYRNSGDTFEKFIKVQSVKV